MRAGAQTSLADRALIHRARLNLLLLNGACMWAPPSRDKSCHICGYVRETLPHIVNTTSPKAHATRLDATS
ncbi:hypothetical protein HPB50_021472 [Hyalomma asiaticum]|uniref:Uncharacterized protein n=1 Tax=Hyalomma asiaticum TaxID=266040 RepID=A0ACB7SHS6_HYAAI|nr:hypothetical protein HPB50_021472 [Hyalomma asiaticum]